MTVSDPRTNPLAWLVWTVRLWRLELTAAASVAVARTLIAHTLGQTAAAVAGLAALVAVATVPAVHDPVMARLAAAAHTRRWARALLAVMPPPLTPGVTTMARHPLGETATVVVPPGATVGQLADRGEHLAAALRVDQVRVTRHPTNAAVATVTTLAADPLANPAPPWPWASAEMTSLWHPVPVAISETGTQITVTLFEHNLLIGGEPGSGKSVALSQLIAAAALDPHATLWLADGKLVELATWRDVAARFAGIDIDDGIDMLTAVQTVMDDRYQLLLDQRLRKAPVGAGLHVVVIDELAHYLTWPDKKPHDRFTDLLRDLVARGRAAGVIVIAATQKPGSDTVPTSLRDLFGYRWALRCTTNAASDTILGSGWASEGHTASTINPATRGAGLLLHEAGLPLRCRAHHLDDTLIAALADRATRLRNNTRPAATTSEGGPL